VAGGQLATSTWISSHGFKQKARRSESHLQKKKKIAPSITGIGHLDPSSESKHAPGGTLNNHGDGSDSTWVYDPKRARVELVPLIARLHLNLGISEFEEYIQCAHDS
jgi:hypothetical protein